MEKRIKKTSSQQPVISDVRKDEVSNAAFPITDAGLLSGSGVEFDNELTEEQKGKELLEEIDKELGIKHFPSVSFASLMSQEFPVARYAVNPFFEAGTLNMVSAPPNTWKSWMLFYMALHIAGGTKALDHFETEQSGVLIVNEEDSHRAVQDRFNILSATDHELPIYFRIASGAKLTRKFVDEIIEECQVRNIKVVMFDSLRSMHEAEENDSTAMQQVMDMLKYISRAEITVIFTHHHRKKSAFNKGDDAEASRGSSAINAAISGHISLEEEERADGLYLILRHLKSKAGEKIAPCEIKIVKEGGKVSFVYGGEFKSGEGKVIQAKNAIMFTVKPGEVKTVNDFVALEVAGKNVLRAALGALVAEGALMVVTRTQAKKQGMIIPGSGNAREKLYMLPSDEAMAAQEAFEII